MSNHGLLTSLSLADRLIIAAGRIDPDADPQVIVLAMREAADRLDRAQGRQAESSGCASAEA